MAMIKGIPIVLKKRVQVSEDGFGRPVYEYTDEIIENVLVAPTTANDVLSSIDLTGKKAVYTLAIPKGDTHDWNDQLVEFFGQIWRTFGIPLEGIESNIPLDWNKKVTVERYE